MARASEKRRLRKVIAATAARRLVPRRRKYAPGELVEIEPDAPHHPLEHGLADHFERLARSRSRRALERDGVYQELRPEIDRVLGSFEWNLRAAIAAPLRDAGAQIRAVAWNVERGKRFDALMAAIRNHEIEGADLLMLTELDIGMGRSGNRNVPASVAEALGMSYVYANYHLVLARGDSGEQDTREPNALGLHGAALLTRFPVKRIWGLGLGEFTDKFRALEKRLGTKRALLVELDTPSGPLLAVVVHLDPFAPPKHRAHQLRSIVAAVDHIGIDRVLLGGDFNTNTYHLGSKLGLGVDLAHKLARFGFAGTIEQYMTPERVFERGVFGVLASAGFATEGFTDPRAGTIHYDLTDPEVQKKTLAYLPRFVFRWLEHRLQRWDGCVPMRVDHFAGRGIRPVRALTLPRDLAGRVSDHSPIVLDFTSA